jgi:hypothetical protein
MSSKLIPDYWGNIIYESAMGLYLTEKEAKEESWMQENFFPLYEKETVVALEDRILYLENLVDEAYQAVSGDEFSSMSLNTKLIDIFNRAELPLNLKIAR